jgi:hypothetical protein
MKAFLAKKLERATHWAKVRAGNGIASTDTQAAPDGAQAPAEPEGAGQTSPPSPEHGEQGMAPDPDAGTGPRPVPVPRVRKARDGEGSAR